MSRRSTYRSISFMLSVVMMLAFALPPISGQAKAQANTQTANSSNSLFQHAYRFELSEEPKKIQIGDLDNNKIKDFVVLTDVGNLVVYKNNGDGTSTREPVIISEPLYGMWDIHNEIAVSENRRSVRAKVVRTGNVNRPGHIANLPASCCNNNFVGSVCKADVVVNRNYCFG